MILYHGTNCYFTKIDLFFSKPYKDFGKGFYCTILETQAREMAVKTALRYGGEPIVLAFELEENFRVNMSVLEFKQPTEEWAKFVMNNRNRSFENFDDVLWNGDNRYDIVIGAVANDAMATAFGAYAKGYLNLKDLAERLKYKNLNNQYSFHTEKTVSLLNFKEAMKIAE